MMDYEQIKITRSARDFALSVISNEVVQQIIHFLFPLFISWALASTDEPGKLSPRSFFKAPACFWLFSYFLILIVFSIVNHKKSREDRFAGLSHDVIGEMMNTVSSLTQYRLTLEEDEGKEMFEPLSQIVCDSLYTVLATTHTDRKFRVSVIKQFLDGDSVKYSMPGYKSDSLSRGDTRPQPVEKCDRYFRMILQSDKEDYIVLTEKEIQTFFTFKKERANNDRLKEYIAIPHKGDFDHICFILQIDCTEKNSFGRNKDQVTQFINQYVRPFVILLENAYVQDSISAKA